MSSLTPEERVLRVIRREDVDYLPSQIEFANRTRAAQLSNAFGLESPSDLDEYLENHLHLTFTLQDKPVAYRDVREEMDRLGRLGLAFPDWDNEVVYDSWGIGFKAIGSSFVEFHPLQGKLTPHIEKHMAPSISREVWSAKDLTTAIRKYEPPDPGAPHNYDDWERDLAEHSGNRLVWPAGYAGIYERSYQLIGWESFMTNIALKPGTVDELLDKVTDYKIEVAKRVVQMGFKIAHSSDDLGTQDGGFFSRQMFREHLLPRIRRHWEVFLQAGVPIMLHSCGDITDYIPDLIDAGLSILEPVQPCMDLKYLKNEFGMDLIFYGGIDTQKLPFIDEQETRELTRHTIRTLGKGGGYIIAPSQEIMDDVPLVNLKAMIETIREERVRVL